jgi:4-amino-4-deoxy-L-arabinose transferase-like glycosyltransferase
VGSLPAIASLAALWARHRTLLLICLAAFSLRITYRLITGSEEFWANSYSFFYTVAENLVAGKGLGWGAPGVWSVRVPPVYPLLLVPAVLQGGNFLYIIVPQAIIGTGTVLAAFLIGRKLFGATAGLIGAALTAIYPYYVVHDTALQETSLLTLGLAWSTWLLLAARTSTSPRLWMAAGAALGLSILVRTTAAPFALCAVAWIWLFGAGSLKWRTVRALVLMGCVALIAGAWMARNAQVIGRPVLSSGSGYAFWAAHNSRTFSHYPSGSIDVSVSEAFKALSPADAKTLHSLPNDEARDHWFLARGLAHAHGQSMGEQLTDAARKLAAGFSWTLSPNKPGLTQWVYFLSYTPILILGLIGFATTRKEWRPLSLIYLQFIIFAAVSAVLWAHSAHRAPLDVYLIVFAAPVLDQFWRWVRPTAFS